MNDLGFLPKSKDKTFNVNSLIAMPPQEHGLKSTNHSKSGN